MFFKNINVRQNKNRDVYKLKDQRDMTAKCNTWSWTGSWNGKKIVIKHTVGPIETWIGTRD